MNNLSKYLLVILLLFILFFLFSHKTEIIQDNIEIYERIDEKSRDDSNCSEVDMKWKGHLKYTSGPFYELNVLKSTKNLKELLPKKNTIKIIKINSLNLKELPEELFLFSNLEALDISDNPFLDLEKLINNLTRFPKLELLAISHCGIERLPDNISLLDNLVGLSLDQNINMIEINENISKLKKLRYLNFRKNKKLKDLPTTIGDLKCLEQIVLSGAGFTRIREELTYCTNLKNIIANASKIKYLPEGLGRLKKLILLNLGANEIEVLPESIGELDNLEDLSLGSNEIETLPHSISNLQNLGNIGLEYNRFKKFPSEVLNLKKLRLLKIHNNNIPSIPIEVCILPKLSLIYVDHQIISDENINELRKENSNLEVKRHDALKKAPSEPKRKN